MPRFLFAHGGQTEKSQDWPKHSEYLWVDLGPEDRTHLKAVIHHLYDAHPKVVDHLLDGTHHRPNLLIEDDAVSFTLSLIPLATHEQLKHLSFVIGQHFLVTAHFDGPSEVVDHAFRYVLDNQMLSEGVDFALYRVLNGHVETLQRLAAQLGDKFEAMQQQMLEYVYRDMSPQILTLRRRAMAAKHILDPEDGITDLLKSADFPYVKKQNRPYLQDAAFLMEEVVTQIEEIREGLAEMDQGYTALQSNQINKVMWFLTIVATLTLPASTLASIYGMNFTNMPELKWHYGYWYALFLMFLVSVLLLLWMRVHRHD